MMISIVIIIMRRQLLTFTDGVVEFSPRFASLLGGQMLNVSGTCNPNLESVKCKFGTDPHAVTTEGIVVNSMLARCPVPRLTQRGDTEISFSNGDSQGFRHKATIAIGNIFKTHFICFVFHLFLL